MLSEGSAVLLSRHSASLASEPEFFGSGRTFTDMTARPSLDTPMSQWFKKALIERALGAELTEHFGYEKGDPAGRDGGNSRNGASSKTILTEDGEVEISVPRDRAGSFEPQLIAKGQTHFDGFDDKTGSVQYFSHFGFGLSGARHWLKR